MYQYHRIRISKTTTRDEHRLVMEEKLGRKLAMDEIVHHKDENKENNNLDNLELTNRAEHARLHFPHGQPVSEETRRMLSNKYKGKPRYYCTKYTSEQIKDWYIKKMNGVTLRQIERETGVNHGTVCDILNGKVLAYRTILAEIMKYV